MLRFLLAWTRKFRVKAEAVPSMCRMEKGRSAGSDGKGFCPNLILKLYCSTLIVHFFYVYLSVQPL